MSAATGRSKVVIAAISKHLHEQLGREPTSPEIIAAVKMRRAAKSKYRIADRAERERTDSAIVASPISRRIRAINRSTAEAWADIQPFVTETWKEAGLAFNAAQKARHAKNSKPGAEAKRAKGERLRELVRAEALKLPRRASRTRAKTAELIYPKVGASFDQTLKILRELGEPKTFKK